MKVAKAITMGMREQRNRDLRRAMWGGWGYDYPELIKAWCWWGWHLNRPGGLGEPGFTYRGCLPSGLAVGSKKLNKRGA